MKKILMLGAAVPILFLAGCGEGWDMRAYNFTPYGDRTAGSGVEYVRAHMMKQKGPVIKAEEPKHKELVAPAKKDSGKTDALVGDGEKMFREKQKK